MAESNAIAGARRLVNDLGDQFECVLRVQPEPDQRDVGLLSRGDLPDLAHVDLARDHLVPEAGHHLRKQLEPVAPFVRNE